MAYGTTNALVIASSKLVEFNQLIKNNVATNVSSGITRTTTESTYTISGTATADDYIWASIVDTLDSTHKYYFSCDNNAISMRIQNFSNDFSTPILVTGVTNFLYAINFTSGQTYNITIKPILIDLTAMGLDDLTLAECQALFNAPYYAYTSGTNMQLIYDGVKPIALCDVPQDYNLQNQIADWEDVSATISNYNYTGSVTGTSIQVKVNKALRVLSLSLRAYLSITTRTSLNPGISITFSNFTFENYVNMRFATAMRLSSVSEDATISSCRGTNLEANANSNIAYIRLPTTEAYGICLISSTT